MHFQLAAVSAVLAGPGIGALESHTALIIEQKSPERLWRHGSALLWLFVAAMIVTHLFFLWRVRDRIAGGDPDFTVFYTAGKILRQGLGAQLYSPRMQLAVQAEFAANPSLRQGPLPYIHPPFEALFFLPLTYLPYPTAFVVWNLINLVILVAVAVLLRKSLPQLHLTPVWRLVLLCLAFFPIFADFHQGQDAILLLFIVTLSFLAFDRNSDFAAGCFLGFGLFKYHLILPLALILAIWRGRKFLAGFSLSSLTVILISLGLVGWNSALQYPLYAWRIVSQPAFGGIPPRQLPSLFGLLAGWQLSPQINLVIQVVIAISSAGLLILIAGLRTFAQPRRQSQFCFAAAVIAAVLVAYSTNTYDLCLLMVPLAVSVDACLADPSAAQRLLVPAIPLFVSPLWFFLWMRWQRTNLMVLFLLWWLFALIVEIRRLQRTTAEPRPASAVIANA